MIKLKSNNKHKIVETTFFLSLQYGFDNVSIKQIQKESGLSTGSIYYYFKNKDEILEYIVNKYLMDIYDEFKKEVREFHGSFLERITFIFRYEDKTFSAKEDIFSHDSSKPRIGYRDYFILLTNIYSKHPEISSASHEIHDEIYNFCYELVEDGVKNKEIRDDISIEKIALFVHTVLKGYIGLLVFQTDFTFEQLVEYNLELIWEAVKKE